MNKQEKAEKVINDDLIFIATENAKVFLFVCKGSTGIYEIFYHKYLNKYKCDCKNVRKGACYHIIASHKLRTDEWLEES